jgi:hypothetical protein
MDAGRAERLKRSSNVRLKTFPRISPRTATASKLATRETALLTPDAIPARCSSTLLMTVVVSGATLIAMPSPKMRTAGKKVVQ